MASNRVSIWLLGCIPKSTRHNYEYKSNVIYIRHYPHLHPYYFIKSFIDTLTIWTAKHILRAVKSANHFENLRV